MSNSSRSRSLGRRAFLASLATPAALAETRWTEFLGDDVDQDAALPVEWSEERNVVWSAAPEGYGQSSPVVAGGKVFVTSVEGPNKEAVMLSAFDLSSGAHLWTHRDSPAQAIEDSDMVSKAAPTPVADEQNVYAFFETGNLMALDHDGGLRWERRLTEDFGEFGGRHGIGSSLRGCNSGVLALAAHDGPSYLICVDRESGKTVWKADRPSGISWSTPTVIEHAGREVAVVAGGDHVDGYDTADGALLWTLRGFTGAFVASPTPIPGGAIIPSGNKEQTAAIRFGETVEEVPEILWRPSDAGSYFSSALVYGSRAYMVNKVGVAFCVGLDSGEELWRQRLKSGCWASSVAAAGKVYFFGVDGAAEVFRAADVAEKIAENTLEEESRLYGVAVSGQSLLLRYGTRLVRVAEIV